MNHSKPYQPNPKLDLILERIVDVPKELVWKAWTQPEHIKKWFTPKPWQTIDCEIDLRPGGIFQTTMRSPEGQEYPPNAGCYLEVIEHEKLVWTSALGPGFRPVSPPAEGFHMSAMILLESHGAGTKYTAIAIHSDEESREKHESMGFYDGWGTALDQLVEFAKRM
jgi:uncharacterized protein YndB with AHSA1/START domain